MCAETTATNGNRSEIAGESVAILFLYVKTQALTPFLFTLAMALFKAIDLFALQCRLWRILGICLA